MSITYQDSLACFDGDVTVEEAGEFVDWLLAEEGREVDLAPCTGLHSALLQSLMALQPRLVALPQEKALAQWLAPFLPRPQGASPRPAIAAEAPGEPAAEAAPLTNVAPAQEEETVLPPLRNGSAKKKNARRPARSTDKNNDAKNNDATETEAKEAVE